MIRLPRFGLTTLALAALASAQCNSTPTTNPTSSSPTPRDGSGSPPEQLHGERDPWAFQTPRDGKPVSPTPADASSADANPAGASPVDIRCTAEPIGGGRTVVHYEIRNTGKQMIHVQNGYRMPYLIAGDGNTLEVLQGVNHDEPGAIAELVERPLTRPLAPGQVFAGKVTLPRVLHDHYMARPTPPALQHGAIQVVCKAGWGLTPITRAIQEHMSVSALFDWQHVDASAPVTVVLP
jgi:hypothetical protein